MNKSLWKYEDSYGVDWEGEVAFFSDVEDILEPGVLWEGRGSFLSDNYEGMKIIIPKELLK